MVYAVFRTLHRSGRSRVLHEIRLTRASAIWTNASSSPRAVPAAAGKGISSSSESESGSGSGSGSGSESGGGSNPVPPPILVPTLSGGQKAFLDSEMPAIRDLFFDFASGEDNTLDLLGLQNLLASIGDRPSGKTLRAMFVAADTDGSGGIDLEESSAMLKMVNYTSPCNMFSSVLLQISA